MSKWLGLLLLLILIALLPGQAIACHKATDEFPAMDWGLGRYEVCEDVKGLAVEIAHKLFDAGSKKSADFARGLVEVHMQAAGKDFAIIYNTGGFGGSSIRADPEWSGVVQGIGSELAMLGYSSIVLEHTRSSDSLFGFVGESYDLLRNYSRKAPVLASKVEFLTRAEGNLKVIITGRSFGAIYSNEVIGHLKRNLRVYSIQAGQPFWYHRPPQPNTLVIEDNGVMPDSFSRGDLWTILRANFHKPSTSRPSGGSIKIGPLFFRAPGHEYTWAHPGVRDRVIAFLEENFARYSPR